MCLIERIFGKKEQKTQTASPVNLTYEEKEKVSLER